jgi:hypothetical protein
MKVVEILTDKATPRQKLLQKRQGLDPSVERPKMTKRFLRQRTERFTKNWQKDDDAR